MAMKKVIFIPLLVVLLVGLSACESRTDKVDGGGVLLSISDFDGLPIAVGVAAATFNPFDDAVGFGSCLVTIEELIIQNVAKDPNGVTSELMNVEIESYEIFFTRADTGTRLPPVFVRNLFGVVPVNGTYAVDNLPIMSCEQLGTTPLSDLLPSNGGFDKETGESIIRLNFNMRFYGRTLSGDPVDSGMAPWTVEFFP